ncbi:MAG: hypothetical protein P8K08_06275 [Fuerstiella sp.]|nr:hypothetical protein [Fuerstiella sp.]
MGGNDSDYNPFAAPQTETAPAVRVDHFEPCACPKCGHEGAQPAPYDKWHGRRAPKAIQDVLCQSCGANYNGETGIVYPPRKSPLIWFLLALGLFLLYLLFVTSPVWLLMVFLQ